MGKNAVIVVALLAAGFFGAYLRFRPYLGLEAAYTDGVRTYDSAAGEEIRFAVWDSPERLSEEVNSDARELRPALSPDGRLLVFSSGERGLNADLFFADIEGGEPREARPLFELCTDFDELAPAFSSDALYFATNRPGGEGGLDLWRAPYRDGAFGEPEPLGDSINTDAEEGDPAPLPGSRALAFASDRDGDWNLYLGRPTADGTVFDVEPVMPANTAAAEREPAFTADGLALFFASDREGGAGAFDLWRSVFENGTWLAPEPVPGVNTDASERGPLPSRDGFTLLYSFEDEELAADIYRAHSRELFRLPGRPVGWVDLVVLTSLLLLALLAWLAKRWNQLEILYKCFLVSVGAHLALLLWFRYVNVEGGILDLPGRSALFHVRLASVPTADQSLRARGGALETERAPEPEASEPERSEPVAAASDELRPRALPAATLEPLRGPDRDAPERTRNDPTQREHRPQPRRLALTDDEQPAERREETARSLEVAARAIEVAPSPRPTSAPSRVARDATQLEQIDASAPRARDLDVRRNERAPARPSRWQTLVAAGPTRGPRIAPVEVAQPAAQTVRRESESRDVALPEAVSTPRPERTRVAPARAGSPMTRPVRLPEPTRANPIDVARAAEAELPKLVREADLADLERPALPAVAFTERPDPVHEASQPREASTLERSREERRELEVVAREVGVERNAHELEPDRFRPLVARLTEKPIHVRELEADRLEGDRGDSNVSRKLDLTPYRSRFGLEKVSALREYGGGEETEAAVASGLEYLASIQKLRGNWGRADLMVEKYFQVAVGKTGLALLAFLGAGHTPVSKTQYSSVTDRAVDWLLGEQDIDTGHFGYTTSYGHGVATYALAECFAITGERRLRQPLQRAVAWILANQHEGTDRTKGGWGYFYPDDRTYDSWPRVSVTSWQVMALESARLGGLDVPDQAFADARRFLRRSYDDRGWFRYSHDPDRLNSGYPTLPGSTPAGLFALSLLGEELTHGRWSDTVDFVLERAPDGYRYTSDDAFVFHARGNLYFWYYATLAMFRHGGGAWDRWNAAMKETLLEAQHRDGSWTPISIYAGYARDDDLDRSYTTAMCVLTLEVYYRYFTPLLKVE